MRHGLELSSIAEAQIEAERRAWDGQLPVGGTRPVATGHQNPKQGQEPHGQSTNGTTPFPRLCLLITPCANKWEGHVHFFNPQMLVSVLLLFFGQGQIVIAGALRKTPTHPELGGVLRAASRGWKIFITRLWSIGSM